MELSLRHRTAHGDQDLRQRTCQMTAPRTLGLRSRQARQPHLFSHAVQSSWQHRVPGMPHSHPVLQPLPCLGPSEASRHLSSSIAIVMDCCSKREIVGIDVAHTQRSVNVGCGYGNIVASHRDNMMFPTRTPVRRTLRSTGSVQGLRLRTHQRMRDAEWLFCPVRHVSPWPPPALLASCCIGVHSCDIPRI